jgi:hypothetical protein
MLQCHVCKKSTELACPDCQIDLGVAVGVCEKRECREGHDEKCPHRLRERIECLLAELNNDYRDGIGGG